MVDLLNTLARLNPAYELIDERRDMILHCRNSGIDPSSRSFMTMNNIANYNNLIIHKLHVAATLGVLSEHEGLSHEAGLFLSGDIECIDFLEYISHHASISVEEARAQLLQTLKAGMVEFHPTDVCNAKCSGCIRSMSNPHGDRAAIYPADELELLKVFDPKAMVLVGGGEPTIYKNNSCDFNGLVSNLKQIMPKMALGLVTNGIHWPKGDWYRHFTFARLSLGAINREDYQKIKGIDAFHKALDTSLRYLDCNIGHIAFNFTVTRDSLRYGLEFARFIWNFVKTRRPSRLQSVSVQYRSHIQPPILAKTRDPLLDVSDADMEVLKKALGQIMSDSDFGFFLVRNTNVEDLLQATRSHTPRNEAPCGLALVFRQIRADGNVQPCNVRPDDARVRLGKLDDEVNLIAMAVRQFKIYFRQPGDEYCKIEHCRAHGKNYTAHHGAGGMDTNDPLNAFF